MKKFFERLFNLDTDENFIQYAERHLHADYEYKLKQDRRKKLLLNYSITEKEADRIMSSYNIDRSM